MKRNNKKTKCLDIRVTLYRSNPSVIRELHFPADCSVEEFCAAVCISFGIEPVEGRLMAAGLHEDEENNKGGSVFGILSDTDRAQLLLTRDSRVMEPLILYVDVLESKDDIDTAIPLVTGSAGSNLPGRLLNIRDINHVLKGIEHAAAVVGSNGELYTGKELSFNDRKTDNAMRRHFAPETAMRELNTAIRLPLKQLLDSISLVMLKRKADVYGVFCYSGMRKNELVARFCDRYDNAFIAAAFERLSLDEFMAFRDFVLDESPLRTDTVVGKRLPILSAMGFVVNVKKRGYMIASELVDFYEEMYATEGERTFIKEKSMKSAALICARLYGIFNMDMFKAVHRLIDTWDVTENEREIYYRERLFSGRNPLRIESVDEEWVCDGTCVEKAAAKRILNRMDESGDFYLPGGEELRDIEKDGIEVDADKFNGLEDIIHDYSGYYYYDNSIMEYITHMADKLRWGADVDEVYTYLERHMYQLRWETKTIKANVEMQVKNLLNEIRLSLPLVVLRGYTLRNCPPGMKKHYLQMNTQTEDKQKSALPAAKKTVKKAVRKRY